jgi:hypothetical protein
LVHFMVIWYILSVLVWCTKKNLASMMVNDASFKFKSKLLKRGSRHNLSLARQLIFQRFGEAFFYSERYIDMGGGIVHMWPGLPDFPWYYIPKRGKYTKWPQNIPKGHEIF